jgi:L-ribulose-5-phosphate 4-epimerase
MLEELKQAVCTANLSLVKHGLVLFTWGNASAFDPETSLVVIKPSGVAYEGLLAEHMVVVDLEGKVIEGSLKPSSDTPTHLELYKHFKGITAIIHTHSKWATIWSQAERPLPFLGTTHADHFNGEIPVTRKLSTTEISGDYEQNTGKVIVETFNHLNLSPLDVPAVLVANHAPFTWGKSIDSAVENAVVLEYCAEMAYHTLAINPQADMDLSLLEKHFLRKHGKNAYYGQK